MLAVAPQLLAGVAHFPRTAALHPEASLFLGDGHSAFLVQASQNPILLNEVLQIVLAPSIDSVALFVDDRLVFLTDQCAAALVSQPRAHQAIGAATGVAKDHPFLMGDTFVV